MIRASLVLLSLFAGAPRAEEPAALPDPIALYGPEVDFEIWRKGSRVGSHRVTFTRDGEDLLVTSRMEIAIHVVFVTAFRFSYESVERWHAGRLASLDVQVNDDGKKSVIAGRAAPDGFTVTGGKQGTLTAPVDILPTTHWNAAQPQATVTLDTLDGVLRPGPAAALGEDRVVTARGLIPAAHYAYGGGLQGTEVWYAGPRWVRMQFKARDGSVIEYRCVVCGPPPG